MKRAAVALLALAFVACSSNGTTTPTPNTSTNARPASTATVSIVTPTPGRVITGSDVAVKVMLTGGRIVPQISTDLKPDEGHVHLKLDGRTVNVQAGLDETLKDVARGMHILETEFVAADHGPFNPRVLATVTFTVA